MNSFFYNFIAKNNNNIDIIIKMIKKENYATF